MTRKASTRSPWVAEGHGGAQFATLAVCAMATRRILLGTGISSVFVRSAPTIAMAAVTVDHLSNQHFILGLGSSHRVQVEPEHGIAYGKPIQRVRDSVAIIRTLLRDDALIDATGVVGTPAEYRERLEAYRRSGMVLPIISPFSRGPNGKQHVLEAIRACAP